MEQEVVSGKRDFVMGGHILVSSLEILSIMSIDDEIRCKMSRIMVFCEHVLLVSINQT